MEYSLAFAKDLSRIASSMKGTGSMFEERERTLLYLSLLSIEITLKFLLEKSGVPVKVIMNHSHNVEGLLNHLGSCKYETLVGSEIRYVPASRIRSRVVNPMFDGATVGNLLEGESKGASKYPSQVRYGEMPQHYPADLMLECALTIINWAENEGQTICMAGNA